jgi:hypothetical protein
LQLRLDLSFTDRVVDSRFALRIAPFASRSDRSPAGDRALVCASPEYLAVRGGPETITDADAHDRIIYARHSTVASWFFFPTAIVLG